MTYLVDPEYGNHNGDNLTESEDDEYDENAYFNWVNHPIRQLYDNRKTRFHSSYLNENTNSEHFAEDPLW